MLKTLTATLITNMEEINQAFEILTMLSLYCENGKDIRAAVQICPTLVFRDTIINKKQQTIASFFIKL